MSRSIEQVRLRPRMRMRTLVRELSRSGVLGAGSLANAAEILSRMFEDADCEVFLSLAGPLVPGGLRRVVADLLRRELIDGLVMSGANVVHDLLEGLGYHHYRAGDRWNDSYLRRLRVGRIADILVEYAGFEALERFVRDALEAGVMAPSEVLARLGKRLEDQYSILRAAAELGKPVFCPGLVDSMIAFPLTEAKVNLEPISDFRKLIDMMLEARTIGAIILGGGLPKHHILQAAELRGGLDLGLQITLDRWEAGSLGGAPLEEGVSWGKVKSAEKVVTVIGDATVLFPILVATVLDP